VTPGSHTEPGSGRIAEDDLYGVNDLLRPTASELSRSLPSVAATLLAHGITAVHDVLSLEMLVALRETGSRFAIRTSGSIPARNLSSSSTGLLQAPGLDDWPLDRTEVGLRVLGVKIFVDGSLGARTAYLREPYTDLGSTRGVALYERSELATLVRRVDEAGLQLMVHAIGDAALDLALDVLEPVATGGNPQRHRLEHIEVTPPALVERLARSGLQACVQPNFAGRWSGPGGMNQQRLGPRLAYCNAYRTLRAAGVPLAFGSDCMPLGSLYGLRSAVEHPLPAERLDASSALELYTAASAALTHAEHSFGRIAPGLLADLAVLSHDPITAGWEGLRVETAFLGGSEIALGGEAPGE
jgi:predicted amidohydrolase YtcJ